MIVDRHGRDVSILVASSRYGRVRPENYHFSGISGREITKLVFSATHSLRRIASLTASAGGRSPTLATTAPFSGSGGSAATASALQAELEWTKAQLSLLQADKAEWQTEIDKAMEAAAGFGQHFFAQDVWNAWIGFSLPCCVLFPFFSFSWPLSGSGGSTATAVSAAGGAQGVPAEGTG